MNPSVLIVDGDVANARLLQVLLALDGIESLIAHTAREALTLVAARRVALVALELRLPDMHGSQLALQLRREAGTRCVPLLVFYAVDNEDELEQIYAADVDALIEKPFRGPEVRGTVAKILGVSTQRQPTAAAAKSGVRSPILPAGQHASGSASAPR